MAKKEKKQRKAGGGRKPLPVEEKKTVYVGVYTSEKNIADNFGNKKAAVELISKIINK